MTQLERTAAVPGVETVAVHGGHDPAKTANTRAVPIYQTVAYMLGDADSSARLFDLSVQGHFFTRVSNPTVEVLEKRIAELEGGLGSVCTASGQAATHLLVSTLAGAGSHIVASSALFGQTVSLLKDTFARFGVETTFCNIRDVAAFDRAVRPSTRLILVESYANPGLEIADLPRLSLVARRRGIPLVVDSTWTPPPLLRPFQHGADLIIHSLTKWMGGHGVAFGGVVVDGGRFDWAAFEEKSGQPQPAWVNKDGKASFAARFGAQAFLMRARHEVLKNVGGSLSPFNAFQILQGLETLPLRMRHLVAATENIAAYLAAHPAVDWVNHPSLPDSPDRSLAHQLLPRGAGSVLCFGVRGGFEAAKRVLNRVRLISHSMNLGDSKTLLIHPASTTHAQVSAEARRAAGITDDMLRLSVGLETPEDIMRDLGDALDSAARQ